MRSPIIREAKETAKANAKTEANRAFANYVNNLEGNYMSKRDLKKAYRNGKKAYKASYRSSKVARTAAKNRAREEALNASKKVYAEATKHIK